MSSDTRPDPESGSTDFDLDEAIGFLIEVTEQLMKRELRKSFRRHGYDITPYQWIVLHRLAHTDGLNQAEIAELTTRDRPNITRIIDVMERRKLIERRTSERDRRVNKVFLTAVGRSVYEGLPEIVARHLKNATRGIRDPDIETVKAVLREIARNLQGSHDH
ncbi:MAG TPA: MarR family transcriptional regulator [Spirochaetia bacterium]|nr:MarR family transcriptional regulator [Spirochaetia bacterium]